MNAQNTAASIVYELALVQFRPDATSEEWLNIGVVALDPDSYEFDARITTRYGRLSAAYPGLDGGAFLNLARGIQRRCADLQGELVKNQQRLFDTPRLARLADRIILPGSAHFGLSSIRYGACRDLRTRVAEVFEEYIGAFEREQRPRVKDATLWSTVVQEPRLAAIMPRISRPIVIRSQDYEHEFAKSWRNGSLQVLEAVSLDYATPERIIDRALRWNGMMSLLRGAQEFKATVLVTRQPEDDRAEKYDQAVRLMRQSPGNREVIPETDVDRLVDILEADLLTT